jgi:hypothetical protein
VSAPHSSLAQASDPDALHIERRHDAGDMVVEMWCGAATVLDSKGYPTPFMDWYTSEHGHKATCHPCRVAWMRGQ